MPLGADHTLVRRHNRAQVLNRLRLEGSASRADIAKLTNLTRSSISRIIDELIADKLVHEIAESKNPKGRPGILLSLNPLGGSAIGVEIGVHFISIMLTDFLSTPLWQEHCELENTTDVDVYMTQSEALIRKAFTISEEHNLEVKGIGVAIWGMVNRHTHLIHFAPNLKWREINLEATWKELFNVPVLVENDANASALGEYYFGYGKGIDDFIYLSMDVGVGAGILSKGRLLKGASGYAGEIGHITVDPKGHLCNCGKRGCLETIIGRQVIVERYKQLSHVENITLEQIIQRGQAGDPLVKTLLEKAGEAIGEGIAYSVNLLNPQAIILGWSLGQAQTLLLSGIKRKLNEISSKDLSDDLLITASMNGSDDALYGSIALVLDEIIRESI